MPRNTRWLFYLSLAVLTFVVGAWLVRTPEPARPLPWLADWQEQVLAPLADNALTLRQLHDAVDGELWVDPRLDGVRLAFRGRLLGDGGPWQVEGELGLSAEEQLSLQRASALQPGSAPQPLSAGLEGQLGDKPIVALSMIPEGRVGAERLLAETGQQPLGTNPAFGNHSQRHDRLVAQLSFQSGARRSKPWCSAKCWSSPAITATFRLSGNCSQERQSRCRSMGWPSTQEATLRSTMTMVPGGGTQRRTATSTTLAAMNQSRYLNRRRNRDRNMRGLAWKKGAAIIAGWMLSPESCPCFVPSCCWRHFSVSPAWPSGRSPPTA